MVDMIYCKYENVASDAWKVVKNKQTNKNKERKKQCKCQTSEALCKISLLNNASVNSTFSYIRE